MSRQPLIVIVGETASGKSALAIDLAECLGGEIICADSRTVYRGMDIGTAKPTTADRARVPHHGLNLIDPDQRYSVADYKAYAQTCIADILGRGRLPILVGGSGLYVDAVIYDLQFRRPPDPKRRAELTGLSVDELRQLLADRDIPMPQNALNPRHLVRAVETDGSEPAHSELRPDTLLLGLSVERAELLERITRRVDDMLEAGLVDEVTGLAKRYGWDAPALQAPGYRAFRRYIEGTSTLSEAKTQLIKDHTNLAKRQRTWFKRNKSIHWIINRDKLTEAVDSATTFLNK